MIVGDRGCQTTLTLTLTPNPPSLFPTLTPDPAPPIMTLDGWEWVVGWEWMWKRGARAIVGDRGWFGGRGVGRDGVRVTLVGGRVGGWVGLRCNPAH